MAGAFHANLIRRIKEEIDNLIFIWDRTKEKEKE